jgi:glycerophosphoryl diester phosphodiesterase
MQTRHLIVSAFVLAAGTVVLMNSDAFVDSIDRKPALLAHRGIAQRFDERDLKNDTCTAARMLPPRHGYLENTLPSIQASFEAGADLVEVDVHPTIDNRFAVFHDWTLDCRTEGSGTTRSHSMADLKKLDVGYGYTADGGQTFPFRGKGVGMMPALDEVLARFPDRRFVINVKSRDSTEGQKLASFLSQLPPERQSGLIVYGGDEPVAQVRQLVPAVRTASRASLKGCLAKYLMLGWTGFVPADCRRSMVLVPVDLGWLFWGWPNRFVRRMEQAGSEVFAVGPYDGGFTRGIDTPEDIDRLPQGYGAGVWTNEIELAARSLKNR